jgi:emfourin
MHIQVVRRGGIAGVTLRGEADTAELAGAGGDAEELLRSLPSGDPASPGRPDRFRYEITVTEAGRSRTSHFNEDELPERLRPVVHAALANGTVG